MVVAARLRESLPARVPVISRTKDGGVQNDSGCTIKNNLVGTEVASNVRRVMDSVHHLRNQISALTAINGAVET